MTPAGPRPILPPVSSQDVPLVRLQLRYPDEKTFLQRFATNVTRGGIFLASRSPFPVGTVIGFEVALMQGPALLAGTGKVAWVREFNPQEPQRAHGMGVQFLNVAPATRPMLDRLLTHKATAPLRTPSGGVPITVARPPTELSPVPVTTPGSSIQSIDLMDNDPSNWIDDQGVRRAANRARVLAARVDDVDALRVRERDESSIEQALAELPRLIGTR